ncbi:phosphate/phosphite/phosphonate ABC transporter substrate-binding protein [Nitrospirota bacterium]
MKGSRLIVFQILLVCLLVLSVGSAHALHEGKAHDTLILAVHPYLTPSEIVERFSPLAGILSHETGIDIEVSVSTDYQSHLDRVGRGEVALAYMGPAAYVKLVDIYGPRPLLGVLEVKGKTGFQGVIITSEAAGVKSLLDLKGKRFAFGDPESTMSHLVPRAMMLKSGITEDKLVGFEHLSNHDNVALSVLTGNFDAGAVKEEVFRKYEPQGLVEVVRTPVISEHLIVANPAMDNELVGKLREVLLRLDSTPDGAEAIRKIKKSATGFKQVQDKNYDSLRGILTTLRKAGVME